MLLSPDADESAQKPQEATKAMQDELANRLDALSQGQQKIFDCVKRIECALAKEFMKRDRNSICSEDRPPGGGQSMELARRAASVSSVAEQERMRIDMGVAVSHNLSACSALPLDLNTSPFYEEWTKHVQVRPELLASRRSMGAFSHMVSLQSHDFGDSEDDASKESFVPRTILYPTSSIRLVLDGITLIALVFDIITIPFMIAWDFPMDSSWSAVAAAVASIWTLDIVATFRTGFYRADMSVETRPQIIFRRYLCGWFAFDFSLVMIDWLNLLAATHSVEVSWLRVAKINRLLRLLRLVRVISVSRGKRLSNITSFLERHLTPGTRVALNIIEILLWIVYVNHLLACIWYWIGQNAMSDTGHRWIDQPINNKDWHYHDTTTMFQYLSALHWSMTQMTPGSMQVYPTNSAERMFNVFCLLMGLIVFGSMISTVSAQTAHLQKLRQERSGKVDRLRKYLVQKNVSHSMIMQIERDVIQRSRKRAPLLAKDVELLAQLSDRLRNSLHCETCKPYLMPHPIIRCALAPYPTLMLEVCSGPSIEFQVFALGDIVFDVSMKADFAYCIVQGIVKYKFLRRSLDDDKDPEHTVGTWFAEVALWLQWTYLGTAEVASVCELIALHVPSLLECMNGVPFVRRLLRAYAKIYQGFITLATPSEVACLDDINSSDFDRMEVLIGYLPKEIQTSISRTCLSALKEKWSWVIKQRQLQQLACDVESGDSTLVFREDGGVERLIHIAMLRLFREDGRLLAKVGSWKNGNVCPECRLPEQVVRCEERPKDAVKRMLEEEFADLASGVRLTEVEFETQTVKSHDEVRRHGLTTKRLHSIHVASFSMASSSSTVLDAARNSIQLTGCPSMSRLPDDVMVCCAGKDVSIYAWLRTKEFQRLSQPHTGEEISEWLAELTGRGKLEMLVDKAMSTISEDGQPLTI